MLGAAQILPLLPENYVEIIKNTDAIKRWRGIKTPEDLMQLSLFHLLNGSTLVEISRIAKDTHTANISDVGFMNKFRCCGE
jgi:hypothetical protein